MINESRVTLILSIMTLTITVFIFISMILSSLFLFFNIYIGNHLTFCFSESCFKYAINLFGTPLSILKQSLIFIPVFIFFIGLYNFKLSLVNSKLNNYMNKERDFYSYIKENSFKEKELFESLDKKKLFSALFMNDLRFNLQAKEIIESFYQNRGSYGLLSLIKDEKKESYKNNLITISTFFGMTLEEEIDIERMDEIVDLLCGAVKEIVLIWFCIKISNK